MHYFLKSVVTFEVNDSQYTSTCSYFSLFSLSLLHAFCFGLSFDVRLDSTFWLEHCFASISNSCNGLSSMCMCVWVCLCKYGWVWVRVGMCVCTILHKMWERRKRSTLTGATAVGNQARAFSVLREMERTSLSASDTTKRTLEKKSQFCSKEKTHKFAC